MTTTLPAQPVSASAVENHVYKIFPNDLNSHYTVFGGLVMALCDRMALVVAERHSHHVCVTASVDSVHFLAPAKEGDTLVLKAACNRAWTTSMEIGVKVLAENSFTGEARHIVSAYLTFVGLTPDGEKVKVPPILPVTADELRRYEEAQFRRDTRLANVQQLRVMRERTRGT